ncbi:MAG: glycosyltransferase family 2 protein [Spirochaetes bacterium]|nr:glycosyltransferase family 2 protein [Spirochaetota bacterium]
MPLVSVIIPCYNIGEYLDEAVDSILQQSFQDFEIIIVNDGSTDEYTNKLLSDYKKPKTIIFSTKNQGLPATRNYGIEHSNSKYICCLDADDKYAPEFLEKSVKVLEKDKNEFLGFVTTWVQTFGDEEFIIETSNYDPARLGFQNVIHVASLFRKKCWKEVKGYKCNLSGYQDWDFWISIISKGYKWKCIQECLFYYRIRENSMIKGSDKKRLELIEQIIINNKDFYKKNVKEIILKCCNDMMFMDNKRKENYIYIKKLENAINEKDVHIKMIESLVEKLKHENNNLKMKKYNFKNKFNYKLIKILNKIFIR